MSYSIAMPNGEIKVVVTHEPVDPVKAYLEYEAACTKFGVDPVENYEKLGAAPNGYEKWKSENQ